MAQIIVFTCFFAISCFCLGCLIATIVEERRQQQIELGIAQTAEEKTTINDYYALRKKENIHGLVLGIFALIFTALSIFLAVRDYEKDVLKDYVNGKYETETVVKTSTRGNDVQKDTTLYFHKIKK